MEPTRGTFLVTDPDPEAPFLRDVETGQVHALGSPPDVDLERGTVLEATLVPEPPLEATWNVETVRDCRTVELLAPDLEPTRRADTVAEDLEPGELAREERAGSGEIHILKLDDGDAESAVADVLEDEATLARAARLGAVRVEVRVASGVLEVRYLPD